jgi:serine/threonine protein phosphatase PrpC
MLRFYLNPKLRSRPHDIQNVLAETIQVLQRKVYLYACKKKITSGGTTFTVCVIDNPRSLAFFANLGDSPGFVFSKNPANGVVDPSSSPSPTYSIKFRTNDHDAKSPKEQERVRTACPFVRFIGNYAVIPSGNKIMTLRGFGDYSYGPIIGREPELYTVPLAPGDIVLVSSDGLLETFKGNNLVPGREENEISEDIAEAIGSKQDIGFVLIQRKIFRLANSYMDLHRMEKTEENIQIICRMIGSAMDNHMLSLYIFSDTKEAVPSPPTLKRYSSI